MTKIDPGNITRQVLRNCEISDARHAGLFSICGLALRLRDLYKWEKGLDPWVEKDSSRSYLRETIVDTTTTLTGELQYKVERYYQPDEQSTWQIDKVFTRSRSETQAFQSEDNLRFIKILFPVERGKTWDGKPTRVRERHEPGLPDQSFEGSSTRS